MNDIQNIKAFVNMEYGVSERNGLLSFLYLLLLINIPTSIFGIYSNITKVTLLPLTILICIWDLTLLHKLKSKKKQYHLFQSTISIILSFSLLIAAYKVSSSEFYVSIIYVFIIICAFVFEIIFILCYYLYLIKKGYFINKKEQRYPSGVFVGMFIPILFSGKYFSDKINNNTAVVILTVCLLILSSLFIFGVQNILRFYYLMKYDSIK